MRDALSSVASSAPLFFLFGLLRSYVIECSGMAVTRGTASQHDIDQFGFANSVWGRTPFRVLSAIAAFSIYAMVPFFWFKSGWVVPMVFLALSLCGTGAAFWAYRRFSGPLFIGIAVPLFYSVAALLIWVEISN